jgi:flagellar assembly factor FliW
MSKREASTGGGRVIQSTRFGTIEAPENQLMHFPLGIPGFAEAKDFVLVEHRPGSVFRWLQAATVPELAFVVIDVLAFVPDYPVADVRKALAFCDIAPDEELAVLAICRVPPPPDEPTANFQAPIGVGLRSRRGAQILLHDSGFSMSMAFLRPR